MPAFLENGECPTGLAPPELGAQTAEHSYVLRFGASKLEVDLEGVFLTKGGTLGGAAARGETDFALSHSEISTARLLTERHESLDIPLSSTLVSTSNALFAEETRGVAFNTLPSAGPTLLLSDRTQLLVTSSRMGASINGTLVGTMSGNAAVPLSSIFNVADSRELTTDEHIGARAATASPPFLQIPLKYPNWDNIISTIGVNAPSIIRIDASGKETIMSVAFFSPTAMNKRLQKVEPLLKAVYDAGWAKTETIKFEPSPTLTKTVTRKAYGFNGSDYSLAVEVNDTPMSVTLDTIESVLNSALDVEMQGAHLHGKLLVDLQTPSFEMTVLHSKRIANALSAFAAFSMPYRVDGTPVVTPTGISMVQSESWPTEPTRAFGLWADDCDGSGQQIVSIVRFATYINNNPLYDMAMYPNMRAVANSIGAHYVYGLNVLAANAGHAANANEAATAVAGHAIMMAIPKTSVLAALQRGSLCTVANDPVVQTNLVHAVTAARFNALYPRSLVDQMPKNERACFANHESMRSSNVSNPVTSLQPLACEGTTFAKSTLYTHDPMERAELKDLYIRDKDISAAMSPNITRTYKSLDVGANGTHAFYSEFVEIGLSLKSPLFTDPALRMLGYATPHLRFAKFDGSDVISKAGASPKDLATHNYAAVPLWTVATAEGALIDEAHLESIANTMPMRGKPIEVTTETANDLLSSLASLKDLNEFLHAPGKSEPLEVYETAHIVSFSALMHNQKAIQGFCDMVKHNKDTTGEVYGIDQPITGMASPIGRPDIELGRYVTVELMVAPTAQDAQA